LACYQSNIGSRRAAGEVDFRGDQLNATGFGMAAAQRAPGVETNDELGSAKQRLGGTGFVELDVAENCFGAIPTPSQAELSETNVETCLSADEALERSAMLWHSG
jgi:hypothetical protein